MATVPILNIRAEALRANLSKISKHLASVPDRRKDLAVLDQQISEMRAHLFEAVSNVRTARTRLEFSSGPARASAPGVDFSNLTDAETHLQGLREKLTTLEGVTARMRTNCFRIDEPVGQEIAKDLGEKTKQPLTQLKVLEVNLTKGKPSPANWQAFSSNAAQISQQIFAEYVEFLGGLALRDTGFDEGICKLADGLLKTYGRNYTSNQMFAIPTRQQAVAMTLARIIRVTFPDWTMWALPSTAREFWHVVAQRQIEADLNFELSMLSGVADDTVEPRFRECLADAFATYTMGPAYAFLAIYQLLDPFAPYRAKGDDVSDELRAHAIFEMLTWMSSGNKYRKPYASVHDDLKTVWGDAIAEVGVVAPAGDEHIQLEADRTRVSLLVKALASALAKSEMLPFTVEIWDDCSKWVAPLINDQIDKIEVPAGAELRHVLNAAWQARVHVDRPANRDLTRAADELAKRILNPAPTAA